MRRPTRLQILTVLGSFVLSSLLICRAEDDAGLAALQGKWTLRKPSPEGVSQVRTLEIRKDKLTFRVLDDSGDLKLFAKGDIKTGKLSPFRVLHLTGIQAGQTETDLTAIDDDRTSLYRVDEDSLTLVSNLDKDRDNQPPALDTYRLEPGSRHPAVVGASKVVGKWKLEIVVGETTRELDLDVTEAEGKLAGKMVTSKGMEYKTKSVTLMDTSIKMELDFDYQGTAMTAFYTGTVEEGKLSGTLEVKGGDSEIKGKWSAKKP